MEHHILTGIALAGAGSAAALSVFLFRRLRADQAEFQARTNKRQQSLHSELGRLRGEIEAIRARAEESERRAAAGATPRHPLSGLNLSHRTQALRLMRKGDTPEKIAAVLGVPKGEIDLLSKVQRLLTLEPKPREPESDPVETGFQSPGS
ncbi:MAG: hypothetical protein SFV51_28820 [Bryobacteraceae bacterium]|nr:hypothetical protein [Bryobacteraceae bacterium]